MNKIYVHVVGPYDSVFVGPFIDLEGANQYIVDVHSGPSGHVFSAYAMTEAQFHANVEQYGLVEVQLPEGSLQ